MTLYNHKSIISNKNINDKSFLKSLEKGFNKLLKRCKMSKVEELKKELIKICHTLKNKKFSDDMCRKDYLMANYGVSSTKDMSVDELREFATFLGYVGNHSIKIEKATQRQVSMIETLWEKKARDTSKLALRNFIKRVVGKRPLYIASLTKKEATKVITGINRLK
jgi:hypothetical protein